MCHIYKLHSYLLYTCHISWFFPFIVWMLSTKLTLPFSSHPFQAPEDYRPISASSQSTRLQSLFSPANMCFPRSLREEHKGLREWVAHSAVPCVCHCLECHWVPGSRGKNSGLKPEAKPSCECQDPGNEVPQWESTGAQSKVPGPGGAPGSAALEQHPGTQPFHTSPTQHNTASARHTSSQKPSFQSQICHCVMCPRIMSHP